MKTQIKESFGDFIEKLTNLYTLGSEEQSKEEQQKEKQTDILQKKLELKLKEIDKKEKELSKKEGDLSNRERQSREEKLQRREDDIKKMLKNIEDKQGILDKEEQERAKRLLQLEKDKERLISSQKFDYEEPKVTFDDDEEDEENNNDITDKLQTRMQEVEPSEEEDDGNAEEEVQDDPSDILSRLDHVIHKPDALSFDMNNGPESEEEECDCEDEDCDCEEEDECEECEESDESDCENSGDVLDLLKRALNKKMTRHGDDSDDREFIQDDEDEYATPEDEEDAPKDYDDIEDEYDTPEQYNADEEDSSEDYDDIEDEYEEEEDDSEEEYATPEDNEEEDSSEEYATPEDNDEEEDVLDKLASILKQKIGSEEDDSDDREFIQDDEVEEGYTVLPPIDKERYNDRSYDGLEGPFRLKTGKVVYYDTKEGKYYDIDTDMYLSDEDYFAHDRGAANESNDDILDRIKRLESTLSIQEAPGDQPQGDPNPNANPAMQNQPEPQEDPLAGPDAPVDGGSEPPIPEEEEELPIEIEDKTKDIEQAQGFEMDTNNAYDYYDKIRGLLNDEESIKALNQEYETISPRKRKITPAKYLFDKILNNVKEKRKRSQGNPDMMGGPEMGGLGGIPDMGMGGAPMGAEVATGGGAGPEMGGGEVGGGAL